jgi:hypothetical protein
MPISSWRSNPKLQLFATNKFRNHKYRITNSGTQQTKITEYLRTNCKFQRIQLVFNGTAIILNYQPLLDVATKGVRIAHYNLVERRHRKIYVPKNFIYLIGM